MKNSFYTVCVAAFLASGVVAADEDTVVDDEDANDGAPIELSAVQMDQITAGSLQLNNGTGGKIIFANFDNPAPNVDGYLSALFGDVCTNDEPELCHPALTRRSNAAFATAGHSPAVTPFGNDGPWSATVASPVISCPDC